MTAVYSDRRNDCIPLNIAVEDKSVSEAFFIDSSVATLTKKSISFFPPHNVTPLNIIHKTMKISNETVHATEID